MSFVIRNLARAVPRRIAPSVRPYHASITLRLPYKDSQDRESLKPGSNDNTKSGRDDDVSEEHDAAYNPNKTSPEAESETAAAGNETNPLDASGANQELSKPRGDENTAHDTGKKTKNSGKSGGQSSEKKGKPGRV